MEFIASFLWEWSAFGFMRTAFCAVLLIAPLYALLGTMVVDGEMAFFADSLGHSALCGVAIGVLLGIRAPLWAMLAFGVLYAVLLMLVKAHGAAGADTTIGVFSSTGLALGVVLLSRNGGFSKYSSYLIGDLLAIEPTDLWSAGIVLAVAVAYWCALYNRLLQVNVNRPIAQSRGIRARAVELSFAVLLAVVVMLSIRWVGVLIISAMLVLPSASARNIAKNVRGYHLAAVCISLFAGVFGLLLSFAWGTASGATIVLVLAACYAATLLLRLAKQKK